MRREIVPFFLSTLRSFSLNPLSLQVVFTADVVHRFAGVLLAVRVSRDFGQPHVNAEDVAERYLGPVGYGHCDQKEPLAIVAVDKIALALRVADPLRLLERVGLVAEDRAVAQAVAERAVALARGVTHSTGKITR